MQDIGNGYPPGTGRPSMARTWPAPPGSPPVPPPRGRRYLPLALALAGVLALLGLVAIGAVATRTAAHAVTSADVRPTVAMHQRVQDGTFAFTADTMKCGVQEISGPDGDLLPTGQFCMVTLTVLNDGKAPAIFADSLQRADGPNGVWYAANSPAGLEADPDPTVLLSDLNPGNQIQVVVVYDIPVGARIDRIEVHQAPGTAGAIIRMS